MSAPESNSKVPPSLLSGPAKDGQAGGARILANLEGRVDPSANTKPKRSRALALAIAALVIVAGSVGAYQLQHRSSAADVQKVAANGASTVVASSIKLASGVTPGAPAASATAPATIVADDDATKDAQRTQASNDDGSRLSRALANGAGSSDEASSAAVVSNAKADDVAKSASAANAKQVETASKAVRDKHDKRQLAEERHAKESKTAVASRVKKQNGKQEAKDDSDADLLAALVARTKPASAKGDKSADGQVASKKVGATATLAERINECGQHGFFEEQLCRWRVCDGHWGKDPHCPAASAQARQP
ncbi:hypothetical protein G3N95_09465 [Paraburkholderia sp. Tr-20389]|uniref:hypothetical protein n=1 Tax=Paraburkholderia sp. Tr-20389 TaxID=2703903 RepID=UPI00197D6FFA|nr:hypothetical protein [Paraburkholderia sp. Tr-20389]MBN3753171.1 hypothetical protein [Paraburkholderia sp. Tr-20389]